MYKIPFSRIDDLFCQIAALCPLYFPQQKAGTVSFLPYEKGAVYAADAVNTVRSAKDFFFPQVENIAKFKMEGKTIEILENQRQAEAFAVFGVRACDEGSFAILDRVFLSEPVDPYYRQKRENALIITVACTAPEESCFCTAFGGDPAQPGGDITVWIDNGTLYWRPNSGKGTSFTEKIKNVLTDCEEDEIAACQSRIRKLADTLPFGKLNLDYWKNTEEKEIFSSEKWASLSSGCLGCGTCTFVCPTCQCYDVRDFDCGGSIQKFRCWDSCMYSDFTRMAHGNPRKTQKERFRQRFMHKLKYFPSNHDGVYSCVGCGRCLRSCPQSLHILKTARSVADD